MLAAGLDFLPNSAFANPGSIFERSLDVQVRHARFEANLAVGVGERAEILNGVGRDDLQSLAALVHPERLKRGLRFLLARNDGKPNKQLADVLGLVLGIARHWVGAPAEQINELRLLERRFRHRQRGLTEKNKARLRQFTDEKVLRTFVALPDLNIAKAKLKKLFDPSSEG